MNLIMFCYNFMRTKNILGTQKMLKAIESWTPDYDKVIWPLKNAFIKAIYRRNAPSLFSKIKSLNFLQVVCIGNYKAYT